MRNQIIKMNSWTGRLRTARLLLLLLFCLAALLPAVVAAPHPAANLQSYLAMLAQAEPTERVQVIVQLAAPMPGAQAMVTQLGGQ